jgi:hypothetical protein
MPPVASPGHGHGTSGMGILRWLRIHPPRRWTSFHSVQGVRLLQIVHAIMTPMGMRLHDFFSFAINDPVSCSFLGFLNGHDPLLMAVM